MGDETESSVDQAYQAYLTASAECAEVRQPHTEILQKLKEEPKNLTLLAQEKEIRGRHDAAHAKLENALEYYYFVKDGKQKKLGKN